MPHLSASSLIIFYCTSCVLTGTSSWRSLLLPSSPPTQTSPLPLRSLSPGPLVNNLMNSDIHQDFHLPDDQFASLKLHKLRQVALESGVEYLASPSYNTRSSKRHFQPRYSTSDPVTPLPLPLSLTPTIANSQQLTGEKQAATQSADIQNLSVDHTLAGQTLAKEPSNRDISETPGEQQTENLHAETPTSPKESISMVLDRSADCVDQKKEQDTMILKNQSQSSISASNARRSTDHPVEPLPHMNFADRPAGGVNDCVVGQSSELKLKQPASEKRTHCSGEVDPLEDQRSTNRQREDEALSFDCPLQEMPEGPSHSCTAAQTRTDCEAQGQPPVKHLNVENPANNSGESSEHTTSPPRDGLGENKNQNKCSPHRGVHSQLLSSPALASAPCPFTTQRVPSSGLPSSPTLPSLGFTPRAFATGLPLTSSPSAPALTLPPPHSPSTQALSPPALSPCPSVASLPPSQPLVSPSDQNRASSQPSETADQCHGVEPATCPSVSSIRSQGTGGQAVLRTEETAEQHVLRCTHTLEVERFTHHTTKNECLASMWD